jgi:zinc transport system permease protein
MMVTSVGLGILFTTTGLWLSYAFDLTSGATIILTCAAGFALAMAGKWLMRSRAAIVEGRGD